MICSRKCILKLVKTIILLFVGEIIVFFIPKFKVGVYPA